MARVMLFGPLRDLAGWRERTFDGAADLDTLMTLIGQACPDLTQALRGPGVQVAVDKALVRGPCPLQAQSEVAFLPPMSGG
jgi:molybdopterin synthase sulfur carrier subunit